jgi:capsular polysaccharide export protein
MTATRQTQGQRVFLFLQGPSSSLFSDIAMHLNRAGHSCLRVNLNAGDWLFWRRNGAINYRGSFADWSSYIDNLLASRGVTDLILLGEERPYHRVAVDHAIARGIDVTVIEMGYLRPDWITLERDGMSSNSRFPNDPDKIRAAAQGVPDVSMQPIYTQSFVREALLDLAYNLPNVFMAPAFPGYRRHGIFHPLHEYAGWVAKLLRSRKHRADAVGMVETLCSGSRRFFVYPLQLETDYQLRSHSPYRSQMDAIEEVVTSFATNTADTVDLVIKIHPLDNGLIDWRQKIRTVSTACGVASRVHVIDGGDLNRLTQSCAGMVTVNSTAVLGGLRSGVPVKVLGGAIYDLNGLTHQGGLETFWTSPDKPQQDLAHDFFKLLAVSIHVRGNFYSKTGVQAAARAIATRMEDRDVNGYGGDSGSAPRKKPVKRPLGPHRPCVVTMAQSATNSC